MSSLLIYICLSVAVVAGMAVLLIHGNFRSQDKGYFRVFTVLVCIYLTWYTTGCATYPQATTEEKEYMTNKMLSYEEGTLEHEAWRMMLIHSK